MLERMQVERMRRRLHGASSSLRLLQEDDNEFDLISTVPSWFVITRRRDTATGALVDTLTIRLDTEDRVTKFNKTDACELVIGARTTRYRLDSRTTTPQMKTMWGYSDLVMTKNDTTVVNP